MREETLARTLARYDQAPHLVFWETTKSCALACAHCRASAQHQALPDELNDAEGIELIDQIVQMSGSAPILVFTGGDCFERPDLYKLIRHARRKGLRVGVAPSVTPKLTHASLETLYELGVRSVSISLDGASPETHDTLRQIPGHFAKTIDTLSMMRDMGFHLQVNTTVTQRNVGEMADVLSLLRGVGVSIWEVFFLVGVGRGVDVEEISPRDAEDVCNFLVDATSYGMTVRTVEAPFFRRVQAERAASPDAEPEDVGELYGRLRSRLAKLPLVKQASRSSATLATGDGRGIIFVGYNGDVHASGFLPMSLGNVRQTPLGEIYASNELLQTIRNGELEGRCGTCDYAKLCGGSRARAFAQTGRVLAEDPACWRTRTRLALAQV